MSRIAEENAEVVRRTLETFPSDEEAWLATLDPEFEWHPIEEGHIPVHGIEGAKRVRGRWLEDWADYSQEIEDLATGGDAVVTTLHIVGRGRESGVPVDIRIHMQWRVRNGLITYMYEHADRDAALQAAGLA